MECRLQKIAITWAVRVMVGCKKKGHFKELRNNRDLLIHSLEVNSP